MKKSIVVLAALLIGAAKFVSPITVTTCAAGKFINAVNADTTVSCDTPAGTTFANPTATAGPAAINGVATTAMRSDAAPAVQKASSSQFGIVEVDGTTITASSGVISAAPATTFANPSATASNTAVNGVATTAMRSDAAPAIQLGTSSQKGVVQVDGTTITASSGVISATAAATPGTLSHGSTLTGTSFNGASNVTNWDIDLTHANTWSGAQTFGTVKGSVTTQSGTSYTLAATDCGTGIRFTSAADVTLTLPDSIVAGCAVGLVQIGSGKVIPTVSGGAALLSRPGYTKSAGAGAMLGLYIDTNTGSAAHYIMSGDGV